MPVWAMALQAAHFISFAGFLWCMYVFMSLSYRFKRTYERSEHAQTKESIDELKAINVKLRKLSLPFLVWLVLTFATLLLYTYRYALPHAKGLL